MVATPNPFDGEGVMVGGKRYTLAELNVMPREEFETLALLAKHEDLQRAHQGDLPSDPPSASAAVFNGAVSLPNMGVPTPVGARPLNDWASVEVERDLYVRFDVTVPFYGRRDAAKKIRGKLERAVELAMGDEAIVIMHEVKERS